MSATNQTNIYSSSAEGDFKSRYNNGIYTLSFRSEGYKQGTQLLKHILSFSNTEFSFK